MINTSIVGGPVINPNPSLIPAVGAAASSFTPVGLVGDLLTTGYNIFANERQFNYQKELNNSIMQREDTAIQRAMADAQNAGLSRMQALGQTASTANYSILNNRHLLQMYLILTLDYVFLSLQVQNN